MCKISSGKNDPKILNIAQSFTQGVIQTLLLMVLDRPGMGFHDALMEVKQLATKNADIDKDIQKKITKAMTWAATEWNYLNKVIDDLRKVKLAVQTYEPENWFFRKLFGSLPQRELKRAIAKWRQVARSERQADKFTIEVEHALENAIRKGVPDVDLRLIKTKIETSARSVLEETSRFEGGLSKRLQAVEKSIGTWAGKKDKKEVEKWIIQDLDNATRECESTIKWLDALIINLKKAQNASRQYLLAAYQKEEAKQNPSGTFNRAPAVERIVDLLVGRGAYLNYSTEQRKLLWNKWRNRAPVLHIPALKFPVAARIGDRGWNLKKIDFSNCDFSGGDLSYADLTASKFEKAHLIKANLSGVNAMNANFRGADCRGANFSGANLSFANLDNAWLGDETLGRTNFNDAILEGTSFTGTLGLSDQNVLNSLWRKFGFKK